MTQKDVVKIDAQSIKWACITLYRWLPGKSEQIAGARAWGALDQWHQEMNVSTTMTDDVRKVGRTTNWGKHLKWRNFMLDGLKALHDQKPLNDLIYFHSPLCVGFTDKLAVDTVERAWAAGCQVYVHTRGALYAQGDCLTDFRAQLRKDIKAAQMTDFRKNQKSE